MSDKKIKDEFSISHHELSKFRQCPRSYKNWLEHHKQSMNESMALGIVVHRFVEHDNYEPDTVGIEKRLNKLGFSNFSQATVESVQSYLKTAKHLADMDPAVNRRKENRLFWTGENLPECKVVIKPDEFSYLLDETNKEGQPTLKIVDLKTGRTPGNGTAFYHHKEQMVFFAIFLAKILEHQGPIQLEIRYLSTGHFYRFWLNKTQAAEEETGFLATIEQIRQARANVAFPANVSLSGHCNGCSYRGDCPEYQVMDSFHQLVRQAKTAVTPQLIAASVVPATDTVEAVTDPISSLKELIQEASAPTGASRKPTEKEPTEKEPTENQPARSAGTRLLNWLVISAEFVHKAAISWLGNC